MPKQQPNRAVRHTALAAVAGLCVTVAVTTIPALRFAYLSPTGHLVLETAVSLVAGLVAFLLYGRYRRHHRLSDLLLVCALALLSTSALVFVTLPGLVGGPDGVAAASWAALVVRLVGAILVLAAAVVPADATYRVRNLASELLGVIATVAVLGTVSHALFAQLPDVVSVSVRAEDSSVPRFQGHPLVYVVQAIVLACYAVASVLFTRRAARERDDLLDWLGAGIMLGAWARVTYLLFPSLYTDWLYAGDLLRLGMYVLLLVGAGREIRAYWEAQSEVAVEAERRRMARDLHDGVVQELGYIRSETKRSGGSPRVLAAAERALDETRRALSALTGAPDEDLATAVERAVCEVGDRYDVTVTVLAPASPDLPTGHREALVRIAREAVANAARHSGAAAVVVELHDQTLAVSDEGRGFEVATGRPGGFGLTSMQERADAIGAGLTIRSAPGWGTSVEVRW